MVLPKVLVPSLYYCLLVFVRMLTSPLVQTIRFARFVVVIPPTERFHRQVRTTDSTHSNALRTKRHQTTYGALQA